jgi:acyl-CoA thioester hydrolase
MRAINVEYHAPAVFDDEIEVYVRVARIGNTSATYEFAAYRARDDALMVNATQTLVLVDLDQRKPCPIPDAFRETIRTFEGADVAA